MRVYTSSPGVPAISEIWETNRGNCPPSQGKLGITVEPNLGPNEDMLRAFGMLIEQRGRDYPVVVLVDSDSKF